MILRARVLLPKPCPIDFPLLNPTRPGLGCQWWRCGGDAMLRVLVVLIVLGAASPAWALGILGPSPISCGAWIEARKMESVRAWEDEKWVLGFLSGMAAESNIDFLHGADAPGIFSAMDNECARDPLQQMDEAARAVMTKLVQRMP